MRKTFQNQYRNLMIAGKGAYNHRNIGRQSLIFQATIHWMGLLQGRPVDHPQGYLLFGGGSDKA